jgi:hypothetical protein
VLWAILKKMVRRINLKTRDELRAALVAAWALIPQITIDKLCHGFQTHLEVCLSE